MMLAENLKELMKIKEELKSSIESLGGNVGNVFSEYPSKIKKSEEENWWNEYFVEGPDKQIGNEIWATGKCVFDLDNQYLKPLYIKSKV